MNRPEVGSVEARTAAVAVDEKRIWGLIPYGVESRDLGGWREKIEPTAFQETKIDELRAVIDHAGVPLGRYPSTLDVEDSPEGLRWSVNPPVSRADVVEAIERGDMRAGSWRMVVARDRWEGDVRHVEAIAELKDVTIVGAQEPAYGDAALVEYRTSTGGERRQKGADMDPQSTGAETAETNTETTETETTETEQRSTETPTTPTLAGSLRVEERTSAPVRRGLADEFRSAGFPAEAAEIPWERYESRAITWSPSINLLGQIDREASPYPFDERYLWSALPREQVDSATTSVQTLVQVSTSADTVTGTVRPIDAVTPKAEVTSTLDLRTLPLSGVAAVESDIPTIVLEQPAVDRVINRDLTQAVNNGLDEIAVAAVAASSNESPGANHVISIRSAITMLQALGYAPDLVVLDPDSAQELDLLVSGINGGTADFVWGPGQAAGSLWNLRRVVSKAVDDPIVMDSRAFGTFYVGPARLTTHEQDGGLTNKHRVRLEVLNAGMAVERQDAALRIAAS